MQASIRLPCPIIEAHVLCLNTYLDGAAYFVALPPCDLDMGARSRSMQHHPGELLRHNTCSIVPPCFNPRFPSTSPSPAGPFPPPAARMSLPCHPSGSRHAQQWGCPSQSPGNRSSVRRVTCKARVSKAGLSEGAAIRCNAHVSVQRRGDEGRERQNKLCCSVVV